VAVTHLVVATGSDQDASMFSSRVVTRWATCVLLLPLACAEQASQPLPAAPPAPSTDTRPCAPQRHAFGAPFEHALGAVTLTPEQAPTVDAIRARMRSRHAAIFEAHDAARRSLASEVRSGHIAPSTPDAGAADERAEQAINDLNLLHATLTPEQRKQWSAALKRHPRPEHGERHGRHDTNAVPRGERLVADLDLTAAQRAAWDRSAPPRDSGHAVGFHDSFHGALEQLATAFEGEVFDARDVLPNAKRGAAFRQRHGHLRARLLELVPLLSVKQRNTLAERIAAGPCRQ